VSRCPCFFDVHRGHLGRDGYQWFRIGHPGSTLSGQENRELVEPMEGGLTMSLIQFMLLAAGLVLSLTWLLRSRAPENVAIRVRDIASDLERMLRDRRGVIK
jgi:hypothetical protein